MTGQPRDRRRSVRCSIDFFVQEVMGDRRYLHPAINLSVDGIYLLVHDDRRAADGEEVVALEFRLPTGRLIQTQGRVVHVDDYRGRRGVGVAFRDLADEDRQAIATFIEDTNEVRRRVAQA